MGDDGNVAMGGFLDTPAVVRPGGAGAAEVRQAVREIEAYWVGYRDGDMTPREAFRKIAPLYRNTIATLADEAEALNEQVKDMLKTIGVGSGERNITIPECNVEFQVRAPSTRVTANHKVVQEVVNELNDLAADDPRMKALAIKLLDSLKTTPVAGGAAVGRIGKKG